jgi:lysophospholipase L1-like esterase
MSHDRNVDILCFGDSLTAGSPGYDPMFGGNPQFQYGYWMTEKAKSLGWTKLQFDNHGIPGDLAASMLNRLERALGGKSYSVTVLLAGSNDLGWGNSVETVYASLHRLWTKVISREIPLVCCTIPPIGSVYPPLQNAQREINEKIRDFASATEGAICADLYGGLSTPDSLLENVFDSGDGLHLSLEGYRRVGTIVWDEGLSEILPKLP